jgi:SAM-dependent methyltransferase
MPRISTHSGASGRRAASSRFISRFSPGRGSAYPLRAGDPAREIILFEYQSLFDQRGGQYSRANRLYPEARAEEASAILSHLALSSGSVWLDVSAGGGYLSERARAQGLPPARFSCDGSLPFLLSGGTSLRGCVAAAGLLPFPTRLFGAVSCLAALHHAEDPGAACRELLRVTGDGGRAAIGDVAGGSEASRFLNGFVDRQTESGHHGRFYSLEDFEGFLSTGGARDRRAERVRIQWILPSRRDAVVFFRDLFGLVPETTDLEIELALAELGAAEGPAGFQIPWTMQFVSASPD